MQARKRSARRSLVAVAVIAVAATATPASAALPVYDPINHVTAIDQFIKTGVIVAKHTTHIKKTVAQLNEMKRQAQGWRLRLQRFGGDLKRARTLTKKGVSYSSADLERTFKKHFPKVPRMVDGVEIRNYEQLQQMNDLAFSTMVANKFQGKQLQVSEQALRGLQRRVELAQTDRKVQQAQAAVQAFQTEQDMMTRHVLLNISSQLAMANARAAQRDAEAQEQEAKDKSEFDEQMDLWDDEMRLREERLRSEVRSSTGLKGARRPI